MTNIIFIDFTYSAKYSIMNTQLRKSSARWQEIKQHLPFRCRRYYTRPGTGSAMDGLVASCICGGVEHALRLGAPWTGILRPCMYGGIVYVLRLGASWTGILRPCIYGGIVYVLRLGAPWTRGQVLGAESLRSGKGRCGTEIGGEIWSKQS